jgi:hypothetical protein
LATDVQTASGRDHLEDFILRLKNFKFDEHFDKNQIIIFIMSQLEFVD